MNVKDPSIIHDVLWQFNCALSDHPVTQMATKVKAEREKEEKGQKNEKVCTRPSSGIQAVKVKVHLVELQCLWAYGRP